MAQNTRKEVSFPPIDLRDIPLRERILTLHKHFVNDPDFTGFDSFALRDGSILLEAETNKTVWEMKIGPHLCNRTGNLHGGAAATIMDLLTSTVLATIAKPGFLDGGHVSRTITMTFLRPVPNGAIARIECEVQSAGKKTANIHGKLYVNGKLSIICMHDKAVIPQNATRAKF